MPEPRAAQREAPGSSGDCGDGDAAAAATCLQALESSLLQLEAAFGGVKTAIQQAGPGEPSSSAAGDVTPRRRARGAEEDLPSAAPPLETPVKNPRPFLAAAPVDYDCAAGADAAGGDDGHHRGAWPVPAAAFDARGPPEAGPPPPRRAASAGRPCRGEPRQALRAEAAEFVPVVAAARGAAPPPAAAGPRGSEAEEVAETIWANADVANTSEGQRLSNMPRLPAFPPAPPPAPPFITGATAYLLQHGVSFLQIPPVMLGVPPVVQTAGPCGAPGAAECAAAPPAPGAPQPAAGGPPAAQQPPRRGIRNRPMDHLEGTPPPPRPPPARPERARSAAPSQRPASKSAAAAAARPVAGLAALSVSAGDASPSAAEAQGRARPRAGAAPCEEAGPAAAHMPEWMPMVLLSSLLDHFFEPFAVQQNAQLHGIIASQLRGSPGAGAPWAPEALRGVALGERELACLDGRVAALLEQLPEDDAGRLGELMSPRRLRWLGWGRWGLQDPPEVRCLVEVPGLPPPKAGGFLRVLAHAVDGPLADASDAGRRRRQRLDAELRAHRVDVACLHGLDPEEEGGRDVAAAFFGWGYCGYFASRGRGGDGAAAPGGHAERVAALAAEALGAAPCEARLPQASAIFWDECRWRAVATRSSGGGAAVDLAPRDAAEGQVVRVVCIRPSLADCCGEGPGPLLKPAARGPGSAVPPAVVCADLAAVGGAAAAALVPGLDGMRSAMVEVTGAELCAPAPGRGRRGGRTELWSPGSILLRGMSASAVLSGHSERYLADLSGADVAEQLPAGRPPLLAELRWAARAPEEESSNAWQ